MTYAEIRDQEQFRKLDDRIGEFIARYFHRPGTQNRRTVILFPGGLGSRLLRGLSRFDNEAFFSHYTAWLDWMFTDPMALPASDLQMEGDVDNAMRLVVPDDVVDVPPYIQPYDGFSDWCDANNLDWFIFGWDWRRSLEPTVDFFLDTFLDWFRKRVMDLCHYDPLENVTLIGHSFGGVVVKLILNRHTNPHVQRIAQAITVGSPFYGYGGQVRRYFEGQEELNFKGKAAITRTISSLRGPYALMFLDHDAFVANQAALAADPDYPLRQYPSVDDTDPTTPADPYDPLTNGDLVRYPANYLFSMSDLAAAKATCRAITARLDGSVEQKFFNIRGVQQDGDQDRADTIVSQTWKWIRPDFDVESESDATPITDTLGSGDGVIPAWSARLVSTPPSNIRTVKGAQIDHMKMMIEPAIHDAVAGIMGLMPPVRVAPPRIDAASTVELRAFLGGLEASLKTFAPSESDRRAAVSSHLAKFSRDEQGRLLARIYLNALKAPSQK